MLDQEPLTLAHPAVQAAKQRFEGGNYVRKLSLTFEQLFEYFSADCVRFHAIAAEGGVSHQAIEQLYRRYFRDLFDGKKGLERFASCVLEQRLVSVKQAENELFAEPHMKVVV